MVHPMGERVALGRMNATAPLPLFDRVKMSLVLYAGVMSLYFTAGHVARPPHARISTALDDAIPFVPEAMPAYALCYVVPLALLFVETTLAGVRRMMRACLLAYAIAAMFFLAMPVADADPPVSGATWAEQMLTWNRAADITKNAFPSMHVGLAVLLCLIGWRRHRTWGLALGVAAAVISAATLLVKQHFVVDIPAGVIVAFVAWRAVYRREGDEGPDAGETP